MLRFSSPWVCFVIIICGVLIFIDHYLEVDVTLGPPNCVSCNKDFVIWRFVISRFCFIHFTVTLAWLRNIVRCIDNFIM